MSLFGMLGTTSRALEVQRFGLDVVGNNLANVNTPGYTKRVADFGAVPPPDRFSAGNGVEVLGVAAGLLDDVLTPDLLSVTFGMPLALDRNGGRYAARAAL